MRGKRYEQDHHPGKLQTRAEPVRHAARHRHGEAAVCRYLDHFEALANSFNNNKDDDWEVDSDNPDTINEPDDEEAY